MEKFEKVIDGLKHCSVGECADEKCLYRHKLPEDWRAVDCNTELARDALALIQKQQERIEELEAEKKARVMTLEELDAIYQIKERHTWPFNTPPYLWMTVNPDVRLTRGFWICWRDIMYCLENSSPFYVRENYWKVWKIWTAEPTDEQMEAALWQNP